jgi:hypothetical protein
MISVISASNNLAIIAKDLSWLWRTAYNAAIAGCHDWEELVVAEVFDLAREVCLQSAPLHVENHTNTQ